jgi:hypothetical protein
MRKTPMNAMELPLNERAELAIQAAIRKVIAEHAREGLSMYV